MTPRVGKLLPSSVVWSDGTPFNGFYLFALVPPILLGTQVAQFALNTTTPKFRIPQYTIIPITNGTPDTTIGLLYNADIDPPTSKYIGFIFDVTRNMIDGPSTQFVVNTSNFAAPTFITTAPTLLGDNPIPDGATGLPASPITPISSGGYYTNTIIANAISIDLAHGLNQRVVLNQSAQITINNPTYTGGSIVGGLTFNLFVEQDGVGSRPTPAFGTAYDTSTSLAEMPSSPNAYLAYQFTYHPTSSKWRLNFVGPLFV